MCRDFIRFPDIIPSRHSQRVNRAFNSLTATVENVSIDHSRLHILVPEQLLNRANVVAVLKQARGEGMSPTVCEVAGFIDPDMRSSFQKENVGRVTLCAASVVSRK